jgi:hypothetical protein
MYCLMSNTIFKSCPKLIIYLVSKTWIPMFLKISSKVFFGDIVCGVNWISYLLTTHWFISSSKPTQFEWNGSFKLEDAYDVKSLPCNSFIVWIKESCNCSFIYQSTTAFAFIDSCSLRTCFFGTWLRVVTSSTTLIRTLSCLGIFVIIVVVMVGLV